jgi:hypothetical protein
MGQAPGTLGWETRERDVRLMGAAGYQSVAESRERDLEGLRIGVFNGIYRRVS